MGDLPVLLNEYRLKNGYYNRLIDENAQQYLGFCFQQQWYEYVQLLTGVTNRVYYFRLFVNSIIMLPTESQRRVKVYMDDFVIGPTLTAITDQLPQALAAYSYKYSYIHLYDIRINAEKYILLSTTTMEVLGFTIDQGKLPTRRKEKLITAIHDIFDATSISKRHCRRI